MSLSKPYSVRINEEKAQEYEALAAGAGVAVGKILRPVLEGAELPKLKMKQSKSTIDEQKKAVYHLAKCGNNLNQVARGINTLLKLGVVDEVEYRAYLMSIDNIEYDIQLMMKKLFD